MSVEGLLLEQAFEYDWLLSLFYVDTGLLDSTFNTNNTFTNIKIDKV